MKITDFDWKGLVRNVAPTLGAALGGPAGGLAVKFLADKFLGKPDATEEDVAAAIAGATPEQLLQVKKLDNDFKVQMKQLDIDVFKLEVSDRADARTLAKVDMRPHIVLSGLYTAGYFVVLGVFLTGDVELPVKFKSEFNMILGVMTAAQVQILNFWFGSSHGSKSKDA